MNTATTPADAVNSHESIVVPEILSHLTPAGWAVGVIRASSQILSLAVVVGAFRAKVKGSRASVATGIAAIAAAALYKRCHKTSYVKDAFLKEFGIKLEGPALKITDFTKARKDGGLPIVASTDGVQGIYMIHEKDDRITVTDPSGVKLQRITRR